MFAPILTSALVGEASVPIFKLPSPLMVKFVVGLEPLSKPMVTKPLTFKFLPEPMTILLKDEGLLVASVCTVNLPTLADAADKSNEA